MLATDFVRRIRDRTYEIPFSFNVDQPLVHPVHLAQLPGLGYRSRTA